MRFPSAPGLPLQSRALLRLLLRLRALRLACPWRKLEEGALPQSPAQATRQRSHQSFSQAWPLGTCLAGGSGIMLGKDVERHM